ncbi:MAG: hypothetical protein J5685_04455 [Clostridiales bacterium]|nr:hypothetical protein [Clostridiales bacterium]
MVIAFTVIALIGAGLYFSCRTKDTEILDIVVYSLTGFIFSYIFFTALLLVPNYFSVKKASFLCMLLWVILSTGKLIKGFKPSASFDLKPFIVPVLASLIGVALVSAVPFDYFGMGQDQGVFQTEAIMYARGLTSRQVDIKEYHVAETASEKEQIMSALTEPNLYGTKNYDETNIFRVLTGSSRLSINQVTQVFHGLHTFSSLLALGAILFGISNMVKINTVIFVLCIFWFCKVMGALKIPKKIQAVLCGILLISPQILWCAKSTLTEIGITMMWMIIIYLLLLKNSRAYMLTALVITVFGLYHVSLYVVMPLFVLLFILLWLISGDRSALKAMIYSVAGFLFSFVIDVWNNTDYTLKSYAPLFKGPVNINNIVYFVFGGCIAAIILGFILLRVKKPSIKVKPAVISWAIRIWLLLILAYSAYRLISGKTAPDEFFRLTFVTLTLLSGFAVPILTYADMLINPSKWTDSHGHTVILTVYSYCVVFFSIVMIPQVQYCYYYSRYLCMYIPMILLAGSLVLMRYKKFVISVIALAITIAVLLPYSILLIRDKDDSRTEWDNLRLVEQTLIDNGTEAVFLEPSLFHYFYYDLKSLGIDVYPIFSDFDSEAYEIASKYIRICVIDDGTNYDLLSEKDLPVISRIGNHSSMDWELMLSRPFLLPNGFTKESVTYSIYEFVH